ncbi:MAG: lytic murein transglycosylase B [Salinisphaera sp.]|jgi:membrane-bound lytic murein transglycosylase B|nr:lytic murein transglycosylase B [Salinisphaera sp.]
MTIRFIAAALPAIVLLVVSLQAIAGDDGPRGDYQDSAAGKALIKALQKEHGVAPATSRALLADAKYRPDIIAKMRRPAEKTLTWAGYRPIFVQPKRARQGAAYIEAHRSLFASAQAKYGVPAWIIAAILGVETRYGAFIGRDRVLDALSTLAFDYPERSPFFTRELETFISLCVGEQLDCRKDIGSYAGAMGVPQFMPSSYAAYAVDGNHDGRRDLWHEPADIIDSVANYLARHGWQRGAPVAYPAEIPSLSRLDGIALNTGRTAYSWQELANDGVKVAQPPPTQTRVGLLSFEGAHGTEYWLAENNFFVIMRYNTSPLYAMAVYQLGREIEAYTRPEAD